MQFMDQTVSQRTLRDAKMGPTENKFILNNIRSHVVSIRELARLLNRTKIWVNVIYMSLKESKETTVYSRVTRSVALRLNASAALFVLLTCAKG